MESTRGLSESVIDTIVTAMEGRDAKRACGGVLPPQAKSALGKEETWRLNELPDTVKPLCIRKGDPG